MPGAFSWLDTSSSDASSFLAIFLRFAALLLSQRLIKNLVFFGRKPETF